MNFLINKGLDKLFAIKTLNGQFKIIYLYRYLFLVLASLFYLFSNFKYKLIVLACLSISSIILNHLYMKNEGMINIIKILIFIEVIGNTILLIPTGGLNSPYIWYSLNTVLISIAEIFLKNSNLILSFILITVATQLLSTLTNKLKLRFLSELTAMVFEKLQLEEINNNLLIAEEQNRIANEIHDSVSQRLFSISCATHALKGELKVATPEKLERELNIINDSLNKAMKELRETIYGLSSEKSGVNTFKQQITNYIKDISRLNNAFISFDIKGNEELMSYDLKKALYRIICEGTGNALHHGKCHEVEITLYIKNQHTELMIMDKGVGFNLKNKIDNKEIGLGIKNMFNLVNSLNGQINIDSKISIGTSIKVLLPNFILINKEQEEAL